MPHNLIKHNLHQIIAGIVKSKYCFESLKYSKQKNIKYFQSYFFNLYFLTALISFLCHFVADAVIIRIPVWSAFPKFQCGRIKLMTVLLLIA